MEFAADELPLDRYREYRLIRLLGWTREQIADTPAVDLDWYLGFDAAERRAEANMARRASSGK